MWLSPLKSINVGPCTFIFSQDIERGTGNGEIHYWWRGSDQMYKICTLQGRWWRCCRTGPTSPRVCPGELWLVESVVILTSDWSSLTNIQRQFFDSFVGQTFKVRRWQYIHRAQTKIKVKGWVSAQMQPILILCK